MDALVKTEAGKGLKLMQVPVPEPKMARSSSKFAKPQFAARMFIYITGIPGHSSISIPQ